MMMLNSLTLQLPQVQEENNYASNMNRISDFIALPYSIFHSLFFHL